MGRAHAVATAALAASVLACTSPPPSALPAGGREVFERHCAACHSIACNRVGPRLAGVVGRPAGSVPDFDGYTVEMRYSGIVWTPDQLDALVRDPQRVVHRSWMEALEPVPDATQRARLVEFLRSGDTSADRCPNAPISPSG